MLVDCYVGDDLYLTSGWLFWHFVHSFCHFRFVLSCLTNNLRTMADFDDNFDQPEVDPAAEFLAREQDELAGLEDDVKPAAISVPQSQMNGGK